MKTVVLDAGHGYNTAGKRTPNGEREWSLNSSVCNYIAAGLAEYQDVQVVRTDDTSGNTDVSLTNRMNKVKQLNPELFVSIHHNANTSQWGNWTGVEVYAHPAAPAIDKELAKKAVDKISAKTGLRNRGAKTADYQVLRQCPVKTPGILAEGGFMDSTIDHPVITSAAGQKQYAQAILEVIVEYLGLVKKPAPQPSNGGDTYFRVVVGSYKERANAEEMQRKLKEKGFDSFLDAFKK